MLQWIAYHACSKFQRSSKQAAFTDECKWAKADRHTGASYCHALPADFQQAMAILDKCSGTELIAYDICPSKACHVMVYRCEMKDLERCPRCGADRYRLATDGRRLAIKRMLYSPVSQYIHSLWSNDETAR